jgi:hypothetical protein
MAAFTQARATAIDTRGAADLNLDVRKRAAEVRVQPPQAFARLTALAQDHGQPAVLGKDLRDLLRSHNWRSVSIEQPRNSGASLCFVHSKIGYAPLLRRARSLVRISCLASSGSIGE